jgi:hypothetical protein
MSRTSSAARQWTACSSSELAQPDPGAPSAVDPGVPTFNPYRRHWSRS